MRGGGEREERERTHAFEVWKNLAPEKHPELDNAGDDPVVVGACELGVESEHAVRDKFDGVVFESGESLARGGGDNGLDMSSDELVEFLSRGQTGYVELRCDMSSSLHWIAEGLAVEEGKDEDM